MKFVQLQYAFCACIISEQHAQQKHRQRRSSKAELHGLLLRGALQAAAARLEQRGVPLAQLAHLQYGASRVLLSFQGTSSIKATESLTRNSSPFPGRILQVAGCTLVEKGAQ